MYAHVCTCTHTQYKYIVHAVIHTFMHHSLKCFNSFSILIHTFIHNNNMHMVHGTTNLPLLTNFVVFRRGQSQIPAWSCLDFLHVSTQKNPGTGPHRFVWKMVRTK